MTSIRMVKLCGDLILQILEIIFKTSLRNGRFPLERKKANVDPIHRKAINKLRKTIVQFHS